jgi:signal recognition particle receptor subunit alpha
VVVNQPDKILFVGEALVGNEAVDQLGKFDKSLKTFSGLDSHLPRGIDGIIFDQVESTLTFHSLLEVPWLVTGSLS